MITQTLNNAPHHPSRRLRTEFLYTLRKRGIELQKEDGAMFGTLPNRKVDLICQHLIPNLYYIVPNIF
jgi:hypothetical protein